MARARIRPFGHEAPSFGDYTFFPLPMAKVDHCPGSAFLHALSVSCKAHKVEKVFFFRHDLLAHSRPVKKSIDLVTVYACINSAACVA